MCYLLKCISSVHIISVIIAYETSYYTMSDFVYNLQEETSTGRQDTFREGMYIYMYIECLAADTVVDLQIPLSA